MGPEPRVLLLSDQKIPEQPNVVGSAHQNEAESGPGQVVPLAVSPPPPQYVSESTLSSDRSTSTFLHPGEVMPAVESSST